MNERQAALPVIQFPSLSNGLRIAYVALAIAGSGAYVASFIRFGSRFITAAAGETAAAIIAWLLFAMLLSWPTHTRQDFIRWIDVCSQTIAAGIAIKSLGMLMNLCNFPMSTSGFLIIHVGLLIIADIVMACVFVRQAMNQGMRRRAAIMLWIFALNGVMALMVSLGLWLRGWTI